MGEQANIRVCYKFSKTAPETQNIEIVHGNEALSHMHVLEWFKEFTENCGTFKMIQGVRSCYLLKIWKQLQQFMNWWAEN
jgi:hypothetical protein